MPFDPDDTIVAIASPAGAAARGIVRLSGPDVARCLRRCFTPTDRAELPADGRPVVLRGSFELSGATGVSPVPDKEPGQNDPAPTSLPCDLLYWPSNRSYTGQPVAEIHTIGSRPLLEAAVRSACAAGARLAQPGEFTLRAFLAGRIDLTQAEAVLGAIDAVDSRQLDTALMQLAGGLAHPLHRLRDDLTDLLAHLEAGFDFADEDLPFITPEQIERQLGAAIDVAERLARQMSLRSRSADAVEAVLIGEPNTGKSSLFNRLTGQPGALVSEQPGTTRDYLAAEIDLDGVACRLIDTAGMSNASSGAPWSVEAAAQAATAERLATARVRILCIDGSRPTTPTEQRRLDERSDGQYLVVVTKTDLPLRADVARSAVHTSSATGTGIEQLRDRLRQAVLAVSGSETQVVGTTAVRCRRSVDGAVEALDQARQLARRQMGEELVAAELRAALDHLGEVVGAVYADDLLDRVFSRFCIGK